METETKMPAKKVIEKLIKTKTALAEKYARLAKLTPSKPRRGTLLLHAADYRRQAEDLSRKT
jgi:hypothetical protein